MRTTTITDLLTESILVQGIEMDATVTATVEEFQEDKFDIGLDYSEVYILVADERFRISAEQLANEHSSLKKAFETKLENIAAKIAADWERI